MPTGDFPWELKTHDGYCYLLRGPEDPIWVRDLFTKSVWRCGTKLVVKQATPGGGEILEWFEDIKKKCNIKYASWHATGNHQKMDMLEVVNFAAPRAGSSMFLNLRNIQDACEFTKKFPGSSQWPSQSRVNWERHFERGGLSAQHLYKPVRGEGVADIRLSNWHVSVPAALIVCTHGYHLLQLVSDKGKCHDMFNGVLEYFIGSSFDLRIDMSKNDITDANSEITTGETWKVRDFICTEVASWPHFKRQPFQELFAHMQLFETLGYVFSQMVCGLNRLAEHKGGDITATSDPLVLLGSRKNRPSTRHIRAAMSEHTPCWRNAHRGSLALKRGGLAALSHKSWVDSAYCRRYVVSMRQRFTSTISFAACFDKGRRSGRDWLRGSLLDYNTRTIAVLSPVVSRILIVAVVGTLRSTPFQARDPKIIVFPTL